MSRRRKDPLRALTDDERASLEQVGRATSAPAGIVARARALLAVADGCSYTEAARRVGRRSGDAVGELVGRFNREGLAAVEPRHGGGPRVEYGAAERERILTEVRRTPERERDRTATWSLTTRPAARAACKPDAARRVGRSPGELRGSARGRGTIPRAGCPPRPGTRAEGRTDDARDTRQARVSSCR